jgi:phytoene dehydrogenase-like protein
MVMPQAEYTAMAVGNAPYVHPQPPVPPQYVGAAAVKAQILADYSHLKEKYNEYVELSTQIKAQMIQAVPPLYLEQLNDEQVGFTNGTPQHIMEHLMATFGEITEIDLENNLQDIKAPWNPDTPIHSVFARGTKCHNFASKGGDPISEATYTRILVDIFYKSGVLETAIDD